MPMPGRRELRSVLCDYHLTVRPAMLAHQLLLVTTDHLIAAGILQTLRRAVVAFLAVVFAVGLLVDGLVGFFLGRVVGRRG
jgi:membrane protein YqaA with SNARE-associated domain